MNDYLMTPKDYEQRHPFIKPSTAQFVCKRNQADLWDFLEQYPDCGINDDGLVDTQILLGWLGY